MRPTSIPSQSAYGPRVELGSIRTTEVKGDEVPLHGKALENGTIGRPALPGSIVLVEDPFPFIGHRGRDIIPSIGIGFRSIPVIFVRDSSIRVFNIYPLARPNSPDTPPPIPLPRLATALH